MSAIDAAFREFLALTSTPVEDENALLSIGREFLPPCARVVLDGGAPTVEYWRWVTSQVRQMARERVSEVRS